MGWSVLQNAGDILDANFSYFFRVVFGGFGGRIVRYSRVDFHFLFLRFQKTMAHGNVQLCKMFLPLLPHPISILE